VVANPQQDATPDQVKKAEEVMRQRYRRDLDDHLRDRPAGASHDDRVRAALAEKTVREYHAQTAHDPDLPQLSRMQYLKIQHRLYIAHSPLGPLGDLLEIEGVEDIHINGTRGGYLEFGDHREPLPGTYAGEDQLRQIVQYYAEQAGRRADEASPIVTVTLRDGSRLNAVLPPTSKPLVITIRRHQLGRFQGLEDLVREHALPERAVGLLQASVHAGQNTLISGATGSGKTTVARVLGLEMPLGERTIVLETETELWLHELRDDCISMEARDANVEGAGQITLEHLFTLAALRQRPKRIVVGEVRGGEAEPMLQAMISGHDGSFTTIHATSPLDALVRLEGLVLRSSANLSSRLVRSMIGRGVDLVLQLGRFRRGDQWVRRMSSLAFVAENREDPEAWPLVLEICRYRYATDEWEWFADALMDMPHKVRDKFEVAGFDTRRLYLQVVSGG
jgi:Flp pilus assembly CpaF family ATPase